MSRDGKGFAARGRAIGVSLLLGLALSACALGRSVVDVQPPASQASTGPGFARISEVRDLRRFEVAPRDPSMPSLSNAAEINDPAVTSRAIARKRGGFGAALGDVVLPEGSTVANLVRGAAAKALQDAGYTVVDEKSPNYAKALPLALDIEQFWAWFTPGAFQVTIEFNSLVTMKGDALVGANAPSAKGTAAYDSAAIFESDWANIVGKGLDDLAGKMRARIRAPGIAAAEQNQAAAASLPPTVAAVSDARHGKSEATSSAAPTPAAVAATAPPSAPAIAFRPTGVLANDLHGRWIIYGDYVSNGSPTPEQQQAFLARCDKSYSTFNVQGSKLVVDTHRDAGAHHSEYAVSTLRPDSLVVEADPSIRGSRFTNVFFAKDREPTKFGLPPDVLVFEPRSTGGMLYFPARRYARCPGLATAND